MFARIGASEIVLIAIVIMLLFGVKKLPDMARSLGKSARILKSEARAIKEDDQIPTQAAGTNDQPRNPIAIPAPSDQVTSRPLNEPADIK
ncbi:Sec-independent protein translocase subunit TatA [Streptomyces collinus]|uniref:Sec-independent protein translocase subunit TatA n=1 Tax=Streptomyces collinus TaxID=42684 RepID=UPI00368D1924